MIMAAAVVGSGVGALARYELGGAVQRGIRGTRPWGTAVVNVTGAMLLGLVVGLHASGRLGDGLLTVVGSGFCGGFTTFSTWMVESVRLGEVGGRAGVVAMGANIGLMLVAGVAGAAVGHALG